MLVALAALGGLVLIADDLRSRFGLAQRGLTPWQRLTGTADVPAPAPWRALGGLALVGLAAVLGLAFIGYNGGGGLMSLALLLVLGGGAAAIIAVPLLIAGLARSDRTRLTTAREDERRRVAAHLHDSVLQTLALVQRQAHDPAAVMRLARRQEHELRAWMAGEVELGAETLGAALREAIAGVEDEHDIAIELTILGERALDRPAEALVAAAREALRNAARHAPAAPIFVFAQASADGAEVFVRDEGPGFELATVPTERRGVRDSIIGRMAAVGGSAVIDSRPGRGHRGRAADRGDGMRIAVVDDHHLFRAGVRAELAPHHDVVGEAATPAEALAMIAATAPDVVLLDVHLPDGGGVRVLEALTAPTPKVLALSVSDAAEDVVPMIRAGALGYVTKTIDTAELLDAIATVAAGDAYFSPRLAAFVLQAFSAPVREPAELESLTPREREVLHHLARGYAYKRIAQRLGISDRTVETHVGNVLRKLQLSSRHEVSHWAATRGLVGEDD